jgi:hypothetical protein
MYIISAQFHHTGRAHVLIDQTTTTPIGEQSTAGVLLGRDISKEIG